jgi:tRNA A37 threonylcarbamoyladenosine modification protein TsaB
MKDDNPHRLTLNIDTAAETCRLWLTAQGGALVAERVEQVGKHHESHLLPCCVSCWIRQRLTCKTSGAVTVVASPGAFTSLRVGVASAKALALALNLPLNLQTA